MQKSALFLLVPLALFPAISGQEGGDPDETLLSTSFGKRARPGMTENLVGAWLLLDYEDPSGNIQLEEVNGFAIFTPDGYLAVQITGTTFADGLFRDGIDIWVQSELQRYRVDGFARLQTASMFGFNNVNEEGFIDPTPVTPAREHEVTLEGGLLILKRTDGARMHFRRLGQSEFPEAAARYLDRVRDRSPDDPFNDLREIGDLQDNY